MLIPLHVLPMFGFAAFAFLSIGVILAVACWLAFRSGAAGTTKLGGFAGCMVAVALVFVAGLGALACLAVAAFSAPGELVRHGPVKKIEAHWPEPRSEKADKAEKKGDATKTGSSSLWIQVEVANGDEAQVARWFRKHTDGNVAVSTESIDGPDGRRTRIDFRIPVSDDEVRRIRHDLERDLPDLDLPDGVTIELKGEDDD